jgi:hypothetical protein
MDVGLFSIGGNSAPVLRRAVYHGDGWLGFNTCCRRRRHLAKRCRK